MATIKEKSDMMREELVERLVLLMKDKGLNWKAEWNAAAFMPRNGITGNFYRGINRMNLATISNVRGYSDPRWVTGKQAIQKGWKIKKGAKAAIVEKWALKQFEKETEENGEIKKEKIYTLKLQRIFHVFNYEQLEGPEPYETPSQENCVGDFSIADALIKSSKCKVIEKKSHRAFYNLTKDEIVIPLRQIFHSVNGFISTLTHEMAHSTGHQSRLNRENMMGGNFGSAVYAEEELRAEFASVFVSAFLGIDPKEENLNNHAAYLQSWLQAVEEDSKVMLRAIAEAEKIADFLIDQYQKTNHLFNCA